ncbi:uncharacterized protein LOC142231422 [Haematobia irritans]|uniref:uncharacterized protein LOC142231422 n=1 Tax=Haematobia irritans TaxID=7368 RepID=UPI003F5051EC
MRAFILLSCLLVIGVKARPEPPVPYMVMQPQMQSVYQQLPTDMTYTSFGAPAPTYGTPASSTSPMTTVVQEVVQNNAPSMMVPEDSYNAAYRHSNSAQHQTGYPNRADETHVHKHVYVHVPPKDFEEEDAVQPRVTHQMGPKQKHYKIVFIKAPSAPAMRAPIVPPAPQNEEKTLIYVLHKKPEAQADIVIPTPAPTKPSKPEVFFIKYKTKKDEAPVYGPPPGTYNGEPRQSSEPSEEYNAPNMEGAPADNQSQYQIPMAPETYATPTMSAFSGDEGQSNVAVPENQYLTPESQATPIVVSEEQPRAPAASYGPPSRFFIKRRKWSFLKYFVVVATVSLKTIKLFSMAFDVNEQKELWTEYKSD